MVEILLGQLFVCALAGGLGSLLVRYAGQVADVNISVLDPVGSALRRSEWTSERRSLVSVSRAAVLAVGLVIMVAAGAGAVAAVLSALGFVK